MQANKSHGQRCNVKARDRFGMVWEAVVGVRLAGDWWEIAGDGD